MARCKLTPVGAIGRGLMAGAAGTVAMDLLWYYRYRRAGGEASVFEWEFSVGVDNYDAAAVPAQVGKRLVEGVFDTPLKPAAAAMVNNAVRWATGLMWGAAYGIAAGSATKRPTKRPASWPQNQSSRQHR